MSIFGMQLVPSIVVHRERHYPTREPTCGYLGTNSDGRVDAAEEKFKAAMQGEEGWNPECGDEQDAREQIQTPLRSRHPIFRLFSGNSLADGQRQSTCL
jgi:hypothetical protein